MNIRGLALASLLLVVPRCAEAQTAGVPCDHAAIDLNEKIACARLLEQSRPDRCRAAGRPEVSPPSQGRVVRNFGDKGQYGTTSKGIAYDTTGPLVRSPISGWVLFAGSWRTSGNMVIIDACTVDVIVLGMSARTVRAQAPIAAGEAIGTVERPGPDSVIYLEVRKGGKSINPFGPLVQQ